MNSFIIGIDVMFEKGGRNEKMEMGLGLMWETFRIRYPIELHFSSKTHLYTMHDST